MADCTVRDYYKVMLMKRENLYLQMCCVVNPKSERIYSSVNPVIKKDANYVSFNNKYRKMHAAIIDRPLFKFNEYLQSP